MCIAAALDSNDTLPRLKPALSWKMCENLREPENPRKLLNSSGKLGVRSSNTFPTNFSPMPQNIPNNKILKAAKKIYLKLT